MAFVGQDSSQETKATAVRWIVLIEQLAQLGMLDASVGEVSAHDDCVDARLNEEE